MGVTDAVLFDIDTQRDFCDRDGAMFVPGAHAPAFRANLASLVGWARAHRHPHLAAADRHAPDDPGFSAAPDMLATYPPHLVAGTVGAGRVAEMRQHRPAVLAVGAHPPLAGASVARGRREFLLRKDACDVFTNPATGALLGHLGPGVVVVMGVATDHCVAAAVEGLLRGHRGARVVLARDACAGVCPERVRGWLARWATLGVALMATADIVAGRLPADPRPDPAGHPGPPARALEAA